MRPCSLFAVAIAIGPMTKASLGDKTPTRQYTFDCNDRDPAADFDQSCWDFLDIAGYLGNTSTSNGGSKAWIQSVKICDSSTQESANHIGCCKSGEVWASCFLRYGRGISGANCTTINPQICTWDQIGRFEVVSPI